MASTFTVVKNVPNHYFPPSSRRRVVFGLLVGDASDGASGSPIAASLFGLTVVEEISVAVKTDSNVLVLMAPAYSATGVSTGVVANNGGSTASAVLPSGTFAVTVKGY